MNHIKMKKYTSYIGILAAGLLVGWFLFGGSSTDEAKHKHDEIASKNQSWTCSMHPQIMHPEAGDCPICGMDLIPAETTADGLEADQFKLTKNALALANIQTIKVTPGSTESNLLILSGEITENKDEIATQPAHFNGRIDKLFITSVGEKVYKGQAIAEVYSPELVVAQQELITAYKIRDAQPKLYAAVRTKFKYWKIRDAQLSEIERTGKVKSAFTIYSHVSGVVSEISINVGAYIMDGHPMFKVANLQIVWAEFDVFEKQITSVKKGSKINITTNTDSNKTITATISFVDPVLDTKTRTVVVRAVLNNSNNNLKPGMFVNGALTIKRTTTKSQLAVPKTAVLWTGKRSLVYVKSGQEPVFEMREVELGKSIGKNYEIVSGLKSGEEIVVNGAFSVDAAAQLQGKRSMMNKRGGKTTTDAAASKIEHERITVSKTFQKQLESVVKVYIELKDALVKSDAKSTKKNAKLFSLQLAKVDMKLLKNNAAHMNWMRILKVVENTSKSMLKTEDIKIQRTQFIRLSSNMIKAVQIFGINKEIYNQFCPMANQDKGANWLSFQKEIKNPYFGSSMLTCGNIEEIIE